MRTAPLVTEKKAPARSGYPISRNRNPTSEAALSLVPPPQIALSLDDREPTAPSFTASCLVSPACLPQETRTEQRRCGAWLDTSLRA